MNKRRANLVVVHKVLVAERRFVQAHEEQVHNRDGLKYRERELEVHNVLSRIICESAVVVEHVEDVLQVERRH